MGAVWTMTFDCADARSQADFWKLALDYVDARPPAGWSSWEEWAGHFGIPEDEWDDGAYIEDPDGVRPRISFLKVPEGKTAKNRLHIDIQAAGGRHQPQELREARIGEVTQRLLAAGASIAHKDCPAGVLDHYVLQDPEGNEFCVV